MEEKCLWARGILRYAFWLILISYFEGGSLQAQTNPLERKVSLSAAGVPAVEWLRSLERVYGIRFSYHSGILPEGVIQLDSRPRKLEKALSEALGPEYRFKSAGGYVILYKPVLRSGPPRPDWLVEGRVTDQSTGRGLEGATLYEIVRMQSVLSDAGGRFKLRIRAPGENLALRCSRYGFYDTLVIAQPSGISFLNLNLKPRPTSMAQREAEIRAMPPGPNPGRMEMRLVPPDLIQNAANFFYPDIRPAQLSFLPKIGTNLRMSGNTINHFSVNILGGYSAGTKGFEAGGLFNLSRRNIEGMQVAGLLNQGADSLKGFQAAGIANQVEDMVSGIQIAGLANLVGGKVKGAQIAGILNRAKEADFQLGLVNIADSATGYPLGLINLIGGGLNHLEVSSGADGSTGLAWVSGTAGLHSHLGLAGHVFQKRKAWGLGWGLGSYFPRHGKLRLLAGVSSRLILPGAWFDANSLSRIDLSARLSYEFVPGMEIQVGPSYHLLISGKENPWTEEFLPNYSGLGFRNAGQGETRFDAWAGAMVAIRIRLKKNEN